MFKLFRIPLAKKVVPVAIASGEVLSNGDGVVPMPSYATAGSAAMDFCAASISPIVVKPGYSVKIPLGIKVAIKPGFKLTLKPRSGLALKHNITLTNSPATIDSDYRGEVSAIIHNLGNQKFVVDPFMRICQGEIEKVEQQKFTEVFSETDLGETFRGEGGFGHTGI